MPAASKANLDFSSNAVGPWKSVHSSEFDHDESRSLNSVRGLCLKPNGGGAHGPGVLLRNECDSQSLYCLVKHSAYIIMNEGH